MEEIINDDVKNAVRDAIRSAALLQFADRNGAVQQPPSNAKAIARREARMTARLRVVLADLPGNLTLTELSDIVQELYSGGQL